jgi:GT2 family glycosyltransferase
VGDILLFFDDDIIAKPNVITHHMNLQKGTPNIGFVGGREITYPPGRGRSAFKRLLSDWANRLIEETPEERQYKILGRYVGRINDKSFFLCDYSHDYDQLIKVNTVRGCNASLRRKVYDRAGGFDEAFQGTALREESDFCMRVQKLGFQNYFFGKAMVIHMRQLGGCNNLAQSYWVVASKMENELRFQRKHFSHVNPFFFLLRLIPLVVETFRSTWGTNFILLFQTVMSFILKRKEQGRGDLSRAK